MENWMIYFAKANGLLIIFYLMYFLFLRKETFFTSNRWYLILGLISSFVLPLITFTKTVWVESKPAIFEEMSNYQTVLIENVTEVEKAFNWNELFIAFYSLIAIIVLFKMGFEIASFFKNIKNQKRKKEAHFTLIHSSKNNNPFSFFGYIVVNQQQFSEEELHHIVIHESIHIKQKHSFDMLFSRIICAILWINPVVWLYRKAIIQNLEFIADHETFLIINNKHAYQKTLLKVVISNKQSAITNQFFQSLIKKRIVMLNTNQSHQKNAWKYATILPLLVGFMLLFQIETVAQVKENSRVATYAVAEVSFSSILTKNTTDKELRELEKTFSDEKYKLKISKVKRNKEGKIIGIKLSFDSGKTYNRILERKSTEPIDDIKIFINSDKDDDTACGFEEVSNVVGVNWNDAKSLSTVEIKKSATDEMIFIINGKEYSKEEMKDKIVELDGAIEMNKDEKGGKKVMLFKGKSSISEEPKNIIYLDNKIISKEEMELIDSKTIKSVDVKKDVLTNEIKIISYNASDDDTEIVVNNKVISYNDLHKLDKNEIESINIKDGNDKKSIYIQKKNANTISSTSIEEAKIELEKSKIELQKAKEELIKARAELEKAKAEMEKSKSKNQKK